MTRRPPSPTLFPYTTLFRSSPSSANTAILPLPGRAACALLAPPAPPALVPDVELPLIRPEIRRSEEHTSELQSRENLVCRLLLEKKKKKKRAIKRNTRTTNT